MENENYFREGDYVVSQHPLTGKDWYIGKITIGKSWASYGVVIHCFSKRHPTGNIVISNYNFSDFRKVDESEITWLILSN